MKRVATLLLVLLVLCVGCAGEQDNIASDDTGLQVGGYTVNSFEIDGVDCIIIEKVYGNRGHAGLSCDWSKRDGSVFKNDVELFTASIIMLAVICVVVIRVPHTSDPSSSFPKGPLGQSRLRELTSTHRGHSNDAF